MNKIKFDNSRATFSTSIPVLVNHLNYGNHLGYDSVLAIIQEARIRWLKKYNLGEKKLSNDTGYLIGDVILNYKSEAFHGDILAVSLYIENIKNKSFEIIYDIRNESTGKTVATSQTSHICFNFELNKVVTLPVNFKDILEQERITKSSRQSSIFSKL